MKGRALALALLAAVSAACSSSPGDGSDDGVTNIQLQVSGEPEETAVYTSIAKQFMKANEGVEVEVVEVPEKDEHLARLATSFAGGNPPDVFLVNFREYSQFVVRDAIEPVGDHLEDVDLASYFEPPLEAFTYDDELQCMPQNISSLVVYYNRALFDEAGIRRPKAG
ncbi:MAG TPA: extracellular solute-binding protein, partial [Actinomycetota bacterium]|nr:extracellular solute-binding protein [Actinomycetota bacterium]